MKKLLMMFAASVMFCTGCTTTQEQSGIQGFTVKSGSQVLEVRADSAFSVELESRMSTGFSWKLVTPLPDGAELTGESVKTAGEMKAGGADIQVFTFKVKRGEYTLTFRYAEHWKNRPDYKETRTVRIIAK